MTPDRGVLPVDWEARFDPGRMRRERLQRGKDALAASDLDLLFEFRPEDCRYLTGYRNHLGPAFEICTTYPFDERLVIDTHPLDVSTGRTRGTQPIVGFA